MCEDPAITAGVAGSVYGALVLQTRNYNTHCSMRKTLHWRAQAQPEHPALEGNQALFPFSSSCASEWEVFALNLIFKLFFPLEELHSQMARELFWNLLSCTAKQDVGEENTKQIFSDSKVYMTLENACSSN